MTAPQRIQRQRTKGWRMPDNTAYVGRPSRWGNPFWIYKGHTSCGPAWEKARGTWHHIPKSECDRAYTTSSWTQGPEEAVAPVRVPADGQAP